MVFFSETLKGFPCISKETGFQYHQDNLYHFFQDVLKHM